MGYRRVGILLTESTAKEDETSLLVPQLGCMFVARAMSLLSFLIQTNDGINCHAKYLSLPGWQHYLQTMYYLKASLIMSLRYWIPPPPRAPALSHGAGKFTIAIFTLSLLSGEHQWNAAVGTPDVSQLNPCNEHSQSCQSSKVPNPYFH